MPPRYAYWTILVDEQPTAFRSSLQDELMPTFKRLKEKHPSARMVWFQNGRVWNSRLEAQEAMRERGERGREGDVRQGGFRDRKHRPMGDRFRAPESRKAPRESRNGEGRLEWTPKGAATGVGSRGNDRKPEWKSRDARPKAKPEWKSRDERLEWKPRGDAEGSHRSKPHSARPKSSAGRDRNWRPGGDHKDPRQKYKDAKKAKWQRFKKNIRSRWESKQTQGKKRRDEES